MTSRLVGRGYEPLCAERGDDDAKLKEVRLAARNAFAFLSACVDGEVAEAKVGDWIMAARTLLEHSARIPGLTGELVDLAGLASEEDLTVIAAVLE